MFRLSYIKQEVNSAPTPFIFYSERQLTFLGSSLNCQSLEGAKDGTSTGCAQETGVRLLSYFAEETFYSYFTEQSIGDPKLPSIQS